MKCYQWSEIWTAINEVKYNMSQVLLNIIRYL